MTARSSARTCAIACDELAPIAAEHELVISHGNGPQVGLLALQASAYETEALPTYPLDVLGAETQGMIGYLVELELGNRLPFEQAAGHAAHHDRGRPGRPGVRATRRSSSARSTTERRPTRWPPSEGWTFKRDGDCLPAGRAIAAAASASSSCARSAGSWSTAAS